MTREFEIAYAAHTASCTFLLDAEGVCRSIVMHAPGKRREAPKSAARCVGAQYVASLDPSAAGCLVEKPRIGASMLFARVDERGRVALVRTGAVTAFEQHPQQDPFESVSVQTSAPMITPRVPNDEYEASERTRRIRVAQGAPLEVSKLDAADEGDDERELDKTDEYASVPELPTPARPPATLRTPPPSIGPDSDRDAYAAFTPRAHRPSPPPLPPPSRGMLPRRSTPQLERPAQAVPPPRASDWVRASPAASRTTDPKVATRRRRGE